MIHHLPYSPDMVSADFFLFSTVKIIMMGERFEDVFGDSKECDKGSKSHSRKGVL